MEQQHGRRHLGEAKWRELLTRFNAGSDTIDAFCKREGIANSSFHRWRSRMEDSTTQRSATAVNQRMPKPMQTGFVDLGALRLPSAATSGRLEITLDLGGGVTLRVARG